jgi:hypothetical protein
MEKIMDKRENNNLRDEPEIRNNLPQIKTEKAEITVSNADQQSRAPDEKNGRSIDITGDIQPEAGAYRKRSKVAAVIALFLLIYIPSTFNWFSGGVISTDILREGALYEALHTEAVVGRNVEQGDSLSDGYAIPAVNEGERVPGHSLIAKVYSRLSYEQMREYEQINHELLKEQYEALGQNVVFLQEVEYIEKDVTNNIRKMIPELNRNSLQDAYMRTKIINGLLLKRAEAYGTLETGDPYINQLKEERDAIEREVAEGCDGVYNASPGHLSFLLDGIEDELTTGGIASLTTERFDNIVKTARNTEYAFPTNTISGITIKAGEPFAKIVKDNTFYFIVKAPVGFLNAYSPGDRIRLRTESPYLEIDNAEIEAVYLPEEGAGELMVEGDNDSQIINTEEGLMVIKLTRYLYEFLSARTVNVALVEKYVEGLKVPVKCLCDVDFENGVAGIVLLKGSHASVRKVRILAASDVYAIIESYDAAAPEGRISRYDTYVRDAENIEDKMQLSK